MNSKRRIRKFVNQQLVADLIGDEDALAAGLLDSLAVEQLIGFLEDDFSIEFEDEELDAVNFASIDALAALVDRKRKARR